MTIYEARDATRICGEGIGIKGGVVVSVAVQTCKIFL